MNLKQFSQANRQRCESPQGFNHKLGSWSVSDWFTATMGELGEAANVAKKLNRIRDGVPGNPTVRVCPRCKTTWRHDFVRVEKCSCGQEIGDVQPTPDQAFETELRKKLGRELADTFIYLDLLAQAAGVDLARSVVEVFNAKSDQIGYQTKFQPEGTS